MFACDLGNCGYLPAGQVVKKSLQVQLNRSHIPFHNTNKATMLQKLIRCFLESLRYAVASVPVPHHKRTMQLHFRQHRQILQPPLVHTA